MRQCLMSKLVELVRAAPGLGRETLEHSMHMSHLARSSRYEKLADIPAGISRHLLPRAGSLMIKFKSRSATNLGIGLSR